LDAHAADGRSLHVVEFLALGALGLATTTGRTARTPEGTLRSAPAPVTRARTTATATAGGTTGGTTRTEAAATATAAWTRTGARSTTGTAAGTATAAGTGTRATTAAARTGRTTGEGAGRGLRHHRRVRTRCARYATGRPRPVGATGTGLRRTRRHAGRSTATRGRSRRSATRARTCATALHALGRAERVVARTRCARTATLTAVTPTRRTRTRRATRTGTARTGCVATGTRSVARRTGTRRRTGRSVRGRPRCGRSRARRGRRLGGCCRRSLRCRRVGRGRLGGRCLERRRRRLGRSLDRRSLHDRGRSLGTRPRLGARTRTRTARGRRGGRSCLLGHRRLGRHRGRRRLDRRSLRRGCGRGRRCGRPLDGRLRRGHRRCCLRCRRRSTGGGLLGRALLRRVLLELLRQPSYDGCLDRRGRRSDELSHVVQPGQNDLAGNSELFRELVDPDLCHYSPSGPSLGRGPLVDVHAHRSALIAVYPSLLDTHRVVMSR
ncbi:MAG: hypothetical protein QOK26_1820, partial [Pseudonocardiales bacterium]|nr:hypothetical protein [Pseudonocardiales bacterium]